MKVLNRKMEIGGLTVELTLKRVRNVNIRVSPPDGRVRVSAPVRLRLGEITRLVETRLDWIKKQRELLARVERPTPSLYASGEEHFFMGRACRLEVVEKDARPRVSLHEGARLEMVVRPGTGPAGRESLLLEWYRRRLGEQVPPLLAKWEPVLGVKLSGVRIRRMKTLWGSCNIDARRVCLNLELARRPACCLEYILVHEMVHCLERLHDERFRRLMSEFLPGWRRCREHLNLSPPGVACFPGGDEDSGAGTLTRQ